jgi:diguanylate cyclase (GGDEF)-like protein/hemerythrin-like metal-binding protein/PAS domain S-box-containing protein
MRVSARRLWLVVVLLLCPLATLATPDAPVQIGVLANRPAADVQARWQPLADYLNTRISSHRFQIRALGYRDLETAIARREVNFVFTNPAHYMLMTYRNGLSSPLATLIQIEDGRRLSRFGGVVFTRAEATHIHALKDLRGQRIAAATTGSLGGYQAQAMELLGVGIDLPRDTTLVETGMPHDQVVAAVLDGRADAGFVRTGILERMAAEGKLDLARVQVVAPRREANFPLLLSTRLYPEWPFSAMPGVDEDLARRVTAALLSIPHGSAVADSLQIHGFTIPTDYEAVRALLVALRLPPFDAAPRFTVADIWSEFRWPIVVGVALLALVVLLAGWLVLMNQRLIEGRSRVEQASHRWQRLLIALGEGVYGVDSEGRCIFVNPAALDALGFTEADMLGRDQHQMFHHHHEDGSVYPDHECPIWLTLRDGIARNTKDWFWRKDGGGFPVSLTTTPMGGGGAVVVFRDISAQRQLETELRRDATTDPLTGVPNRRSFLDSLARELNRVKRFGYPATATLIMADLDHFKRINDHYGHAIGDEALRHFTELGRQHLRSTDSIGRLGGEEFGILMPLTDAQDALEFARRFCAIVADNPARTEQGEIHFTVSLGLTELSASDASSEDVLERADAALYRAKAGGRNRVEQACAPSAGPDGSPGGRLITHLRWRDSYASGEPAIDQEHQDLFARANQVLGLALHTYDDVHSGAALQQALGDLLEHVEHHFEHEEAILLARGYPELAAHAAMHHKLAEDAQALYRRLEAASPDDLPQLGRAVSFLVVDMVAMHMLKEDRRFFRYLAHRAA